MRIWLHIGPEQAGAARLQQVLADKREALLRKGILYPQSPGTPAHTRLYMAVTDPDHVDPLRFDRGYAGHAEQAALRMALIDELRGEIALHAPRALLLSAAQLGASLHRVSELERLKALLTPFSDDIRILAHVDEPARLLARHYAAQIFEGRAAPLNRELELAAAPDWWRACLEATPPIAPQAGRFIETQGPPFWLDYTALVAFWENRFGAGAVTLRPYDPARFAGADVTDEIRAALEIKGSIGRAAAAPVPDPPAAAWLARARQFNALIPRLLAGGKYLLPRPLWRRLLDEIEIAGPPVAPGSLAAVSARFAEANKALVAAHPALSRQVFVGERTRKPWTEPDPGNGYRASQYLLAFMYRIEKAGRTERKAGAAAPAPPAPIVPPDAIGPRARRLMSPLAMRNYEKLKSSRFAPHNRLGTIDEEEPAAAYDPVPPRALPAGSTGNVIVGCMKNEAPYIVEWVAYHRAIGVDNFLIYTNDCTDGTAEILGRLHQLGIVEHRNNDNWKGNSPQQHALNLSLKEKIIEQAEWIIHIDVDEFMNIRTGNGTVQDFLAAVPDATNVAMTWRLFGHNGVTRLADEFVIAQFDGCAPKYCPKPHTVWGFKTMSRNIGAYAKLSCHRPNKLDSAFRDRVRWVNGSGRDMTAEVAENGWRNSRKSIGYDLLQLNHYALRSAESFLIKRQRGRALHVDRAIGLNYWIRMDWSGARDLTIKRNLPRLRAEYDRLMQDITLRRLHRRGLAWHRAKADELLATPEFEDLYRKALDVRLNETERVAYALALDMES